MEVLGLARVLRRPPNTAKNVIPALGRQGGWISCKNEGLPGWQTIGAGIRRLNDSVEGDHVAQKRLGNARAIAGPLLLIAEG